MDESDGAGRLAFWCVLALAAAALVAPWWGHVDDTDAQLYQVVARGMAARHSWLDPRYLPRVYPHFREHLPFGLWPFVAAIRLFGEWALAPLAALETLGAIALTGWLGRRLAGRWAGAAAMATLALNESVVFYGGRPKLDPLLVLLATAAAAPVLLGRPRLRGWALAAGLAALAALVKGPFGLVPLVAATVARAVEERSFRTLVVGGLATLAALVPVTAFLLGQRQWGDPSWWSGYVLHQIVSSATGTRHDGRGGWIFPFATLTQRFWPGLALLPFALGRALKPGGRVDDGQVPCCRLLAVTGLVALLILAIPGRKVWNHELVAFPLFALLAGAGLAPLLEKASGRWRRSLATGAAVLAAAGWIAALSGAGRRWDRPPCVCADEFAPWLARLAPGTPIPVVAQPTDWRLVAGLAEERSLAPYPVASVASLGRAPLSVRLAIVVGPPPASWPAGWHERRGARGYELLGR